MLSALYELSITVFQNILIYYCNCFFVFKRNIICFSVIIVLAVSTIHY